MKYSIIVTTSNHCEDYLKPCIQSIEENSDMAITEILVVANGCKDGTREYLEEKKLKSIWFDESIGYTKAVNEGLRVVNGEYIVLLNDDTVIKGSQWLDLLEKPFKDPQVGITGPMKFTWMCGEIERTAMAFWCVMIRQTLIQEIGLLDEVFNPGMGEDGDYCIRAELVGYKLVQVPEDGSKEFGEGTDNLSFPIYHKGNGTFAEPERQKDEVVARNNKILEEKYSNRLEKIYNICLGHECDINGLFPTLRKYAQKCEHITEFGVRGVFSTYAFLAARPRVMRSYDIETSANINEAGEVSAENGIDFIFKAENVLETAIEETDLLFIDTLHVYRQLKQELALHADKVHKYILMHDTETWGEDDEIPIENEEPKGLKLAIVEFLDENPQWKVKEHIKESNGLTILERIPTYSIVIPTHNRREALEMCLDSVFNYTNLADKEIIVVANGCTDDTLEYLDKLRHYVRILNIPEPAGQVIPAEMGVDAARGEYIILLDDDCQLLEQPEDAWVQALKEPHKDKVAITGVFGAEYPYLGEAMHNGCTMFPKKVWEEVDGFDGVFGFGYLYDTDFSLRVKGKGYEIVKVGGAGTFPIYHPESPVTSETKQKQVSLIRKNREILYRRHGMKPKYSVVVPSYGHLEDCLKPCLESVKKNTDLENVEVIVVSNGSTKETAEYVDSLGHPFKLLWYDEKIGFTRATNKGIEYAQGEYVILLNNDTVILDMAGKNGWINMLEAPFLADEKMGISGPLSLHDDYADHDVIIFFCAMIKRKMFDIVGMLDEDFSPGGGEDIDFCMKLVQAGYHQATVPYSELRLDSCDDGEVTNVGGFPIYHKGEATFSKEEWPDYGNRIIKENGTKNMLKYNKHIRLNLGSGGVEVPGYISVDKYDTRASILWDVFDLDQYLPENSVEELLASHLFEHVNPYKSVEMLKKWLKILKPGGRLIMELPNIEELCKDFVKGSKEERYGILNCIYGSVNTKEVGDKSEITSPHLWGWYPEIMYDHLVWAGFTDIQILPEQIPHPHKNFRVEAIKPVLFRDELDKVVYDNVEPGDSVLDIGCGDKGRTRLLTRNNQITSIDAWEKVNPDLLIDLEQEEKLPYPDNSFDVVLMLDFIEHLSKDAGIPIIKEAQRVCRKKLILFTPAFWTDNKECVEDPNMWSYGNQYDLHKSFWSVEDFKDWDAYPYSDPRFILRIWRPNEVFNTAAILQAT